MIVCVFCEERKRTLRKHKLFSFYDSLIDKELAGINLVTAPDLNVCTPVSYTHLDVYKRQIMIWAFIDFVTTTWLTNFQSKTRVFTEIYVNFQHVYPQLWSKFSRSDTSYFLIFVIQPLTPVKPVGSSSVNSFCTTTEYVALDWQTVRQGSAVSFEYWRTQIVVWYHT